VRTASCIYEGSIRHRRPEPRHEFRHRLALAYLDLDELPRLLDGRLVDRRPGLVRFRRADYLGEPAKPLAEAVRDRVVEELGSRPSGPVRLLTHLRSFGHCFNPVSFYYCFDSSGAEVEAMVADVTNTPWGERHSYVIAGRRGRFAKALHVSPFLSMDQTYVCQATFPGERLSIHIENRRAGARVFDATLTLSRRELTARSLRRITLRYPAASARVLGLIYAHALALRLAGAPVFKHPGSARA
jgi:DUF1365 family protein